jgi:ABC-type sugar transport system ATPase subunit
MSDSVILDIRQISKSFPGVQALDSISFSVRAGEVHALVGENGAGKSTLIKILSGVYHATSGSFTFKGKDVHINSPLEAQMLGMSVVHQELKLVESLTVAENIYLGRPVRTKALGFLPLVDWKKMTENANALLEKLKVKLDLGARVSRLSIAQKQIVEICKALSFNAELIIMDEPSATLTEKELEVLFGMLKMLNENGVSIIYISHRIEEIFRLAHTVTVLRDGRHISTSPVSQVTKRSLISMMVGRELESEYPKTPAPIGEVLLEARGLSRGTRLHDISFSLHRGEILGIAGLVGAGRTELARAVFGADGHDSGEIFVKGRKVEIRRVSDAVRHRLGFVPEDRKLQGLVLGMTVKENISLAGIVKVIRRRVIVRKLERKLALDFIQALRIVTPDENKEVKYLSGGNQQKVVLAKWLAVDSDILIFDEPTRGVDVGAKTEIYRLLNGLVAEGKGVIMISSELPEIMGMCDRILVMHDGRITGELQRGEATQEKVLELATM